MRINQLTVEAHWLLLVKEEGGWLAVPASRVPKEAVFTILFVKEIKNTTQLSISFTNKIAFHPHNILQRWQVGIIISMKKGMEDQFTSHQRQRALNHRELPHDSIGIYVFIYFRLSLKLLIKRVFKLSHCHT